MGVAGSFGRGHFEHVAPVGNLSLACARLDFPVPDKDRRFDSGAPSYAVGVVDDVVLGDGFAFGAFVCGVVGGYLEF